MNLIQEIKRQAIKTADVDRTNHFINVRRITSVRLSRINIFPSDQKINVDDQLNNR